ncbi:MAG: Clp protease ClpP [Rhodospirillales bacterium]
MPVAAIEKPSQRSGGAWYRVTAKADAGEILIYEEIGAFGITAKSFIDDLRSLGNVTRLAARINSPGGDIFSAVGIFNALARHPAKTTVYVDGLAASAASLVAMAGDEIMMPSNSFMMIHDPAAAVIGGAADLRSMAEALDRITQSMVGIYVAKTGLPEDEVRRLMGAETWFSADEALAKGFATQVTNAVQMAARFDLGRYKRPPSALTQPVRAAAPVRTAAPSPASPKLSSAALWDRVLKRKFGGTK